MLLRDRFWQWGHTEGRYNNVYGIKETSRMTPMEGCLYFGIPNTFMVPVAEEVNRRQYNKSFKTLKEVVWECYAAGYDPSAVDAIIEDSKEFKNITGIVFDDFARGGMKQYSQMSVDNLIEVRRKLKEDGPRPLNMWTVLYVDDFGVDLERDAVFAKYLEPFDGVTMWLRLERDIPLLDEKFNYLKKLAPNKRMLFGCYLYEHRRSCQASAAGVIKQLDWYRERILAGEAEGVVLHTNAWADIEYEASDAAVSWMEEHGDEIVADL